MTTPEPSRARMSIGEVLGHLRAEFSDITISKIRYLETEGLVEPERTPSGYRKFSHGDLDRLQYVLRLQRDRFLPLKVIRQKLDDLDRGLVPDDEVDAIRVPRVVLADDGYPTADSLRQSRTELRLTRAELLRAADVSEEMLDEMEQHGLVTRRTPTSPYDGSALVVARCVAELAAFGLEPRHLRAFRASADREIGMFDQVVSPLQRQRDPGGAEETVRNLAALSVRLHTTLVKQGLRHRD
ncbi:MAG: MerR family transcriptional regulator [Nocardioidaceae bacterium]|nr:MerR family transcriptional regulator [Nocardioidaceae bacterium]